uniref:Uncharacterized protein n=1 Tax=Anopheles arabiensis TaxID=7173 RepID=A0A182IGU3_ANOAR
MPAVSRLRCNHHYGKVVLFVILSVLLAFSRNIHPSTTRMSAQHLMTKSRKDFIL